MVVLRSWASCGSSCVIGPSAGSGGSDDGRRVLLRGGRADPIRRAGRHRSTDVQGLRARSPRPGQADGGPPPHRRLPVALVQLARIGRLRFGDVRPAVAEARRRPDGRCPGKARRGVRIPRQAGRPVLLLPRSRRRAGGSHLRRVDGQPRGDRRRGRGAHGADRREAPVGDSQPVRPSALRGRSGHQPRSRGLRLRRGPGEGHDGDDQAPGRRELRPVGRPRGLRDAAQHGPRPRGGAARPVPGHGRRAQVPDRLRGRAPDRAQADGADEAPVRLRLRDGPRLPGPPRARARVQGQHRGQPRDAGRAQLPPRGGVRHCRRHLREHRREPRRLPERLGHRPVPELGRRAVAGDVRDPARRRGRDRGVQLRRQAPPPEHGPGRPVPCPHRGHRHARPVAPGGRRHGRAGHPRRHAGGSLRRLGRRSRAGDPVR